MNPEKRKDRVALAWIIAWIGLPFLFGSLDLIGLAFLSGIVVPVLMILADPWPFNEKKRR